MVAALTFNGLNLNSDPYFIDSITGLLDSPEIRTTDRPLVGRDGLVAGIDRYSGRSVSVVIGINGFTSAAFSAAVQAFSVAFSAPKAIPLPLSFTIPGVANGAPARINVRPRKVSLPIEAVYQEGWGTAAVELFATDPLVYSDTENTVTIPIAGPHGGRTYDRIYDVTYSGSGSFGSSAITNNGSALAPVVIKIFGPVLNPTIRNVTTGQSLVFTVDLLAGDYLLIDYATRTVLLNGTADRYSYLTTPQWWGLVPGLNEIRYFADTTSLSTATVTYRSAWI
jgi:hypothetical protein